MEITDAVHQTVTTPRVESGRLPQLDALRTLAVLLVICTHKQVFYLPGRIGWVGVDLFFVLSGYLISGLLFTEYQKTRTINIKRFLIRRGFKIYPSFYLFLVVSILIEKLVSNRLITKAELAAEVFFYQNYFARFWGHTWSLAVEEHFYLLLPFCLFFLLHLFRKSKDPFKFLPTLLVCLMLIILTGRTYSAWRGFWVYSHTHTRADALAGGVLVSYFWHFKNAITLSIIQRFKWIVVLIIPFFILPAYLCDYDSFFISSIGFTMVWGGMAGLLLLAISVPVNTGIVRVFARPGIYSYPVYLWHGALIHWLTFPDTIFGFTLYLLISFTAGVLMFNLMERPSLRVRDRLFPIAS